MCGFPLRKRKFWPLVAVLLPFILAMVQRKVSGVIGLKQGVYWLIEAWGVEKFRQLLETETGLAFEEAAPEDAFTMDKRDHIGGTSPETSGFKLHRYSCACGSFKQRKICLRWRVWQKPMVRVKFGQQ